MAAVKRKKDDADSTGPSTGASAAATPDATTLVQNQGSTEIAKTPAESGKGDKGAQAGKGGGGGEKGGSGDGGRGGGGGGGKDDKGAKKADSRPFYARILQFIKEVVAEFRKITWPTRHQVTKETWSVLFLVTAITLMVLGFDWVLSHAFFQPIEHWARLHGGGIGRGY